MSLHKIIWWRTKTIKLGDKQEEQVPDIQADGTCACEVHYMVGYCPQTITEFRAMAEEIRKTFPEASDDKIECGKIYKSDWCCGFTIVIWTAKLKFKRYRGWSSRESGGIDYYW